LPTLIGFRLTPFFLIICVLECLVALQRTVGLAAVLDFINVSPELKPNNITDDEDKTKSSIELRLPEQS